MPNNLRRVASYLLLGRIWESPGIGGAAVAAHPGWHASEAIANGSRFGTLGFAEPSIDSIASIFVAKIDFDLT